jgi:CHAT domain-containing protein
MPRSISIVVARLLLVVMLLIWTPQGSLRGELQGQARQDPSQNAGKAAAANEALRQAQNLEAKGSPESLNKAIEKYQEALLLFRAIGHRPYVAVILTLMGGIYSVIGEQQKAIDSYNQALPLLRAMGDREHEATTLNAIGMVYDHLGDILKSLDHYAQALRIRKALGDRQGEAQTIHNVAQLYGHFGENERALTLFNKALLMFRGVGDKRAEATTLNDIGLVYDALGEKQKALDYFNQALPLMRAAGNPKGEATALGSIAMVYFSLGEKDKALDYYNQTLTILKSVVDRPLEAAALTGIAGIYGSRGELEKALDYHNRALALVRGVGFRRGEAATLNNIAVIYRHLGQGPKAREYYYQSLSIQVITGDQAGEATTLSNLMVLWTPRNARLAVFFGKQAVNLYQKLRANITGLDKELQKNFLKTKEQAYRALADLLISQGRLSEAQQVLNLFKDQQFFDFNHNTQSLASALALTPREAAASDRYARAKTSTDVLAVLKQVEEEFAQPSTEGDKAGEIADTRELQRALGELSRQTGQKAVAVYTLVGEDNFRALLITVDHIAGASQPVKGDVLNQKALKLWGLLQSDKFDPMPLAQELYSIVFKPIEAQLPKDTNTILWSLDDNLRYVPMAALNDGKQYLVERYNHAVFTRADSERLLRATSPRWTGLGLGSSQAHTVELLGDTITFNALPGVTEELRVLFRQKGSPGGVLDGEVLPDAQFTKSAMLSALKQKRPLVHISSHFAFRPGDEARSFLLLGDGTAMSLEEMKQHTDLFAGVELLTLSACNTAAQQAGANGREVDGFAELAQRLGAGSVMATLWPVADNSTPWLMREFYQTRQSGNGLTKVEAFRRAQLALLNGTAQTKPLPEAQKGASSTVKIVVTSDDSKSVGANSDTRGAFVTVSAKEAPAFKRDEKRPFAHPYYWAPFILIGNLK